MDQGGAFLEAIVEEPDDLTSRLAFADWLEDSGNSDRAEFIRLQISRMSLRPTDPRYRSALRRENDLLARHQTEWIGSQARHSCRFRFHRGFIEEISIPIDEFLAHGEALFRRSPIQRVHLREVNRLPLLLEEHPPLSQVLARHLRHIRVLNLNHAHLNDATGLCLLNLPEFPRLTALHLRQNCLSPAGVRIMADSPVIDNLTVLEFHSTSSARDILEPLLFSKRLTQLQHLSLSGLVHRFRIVPLLISSGILSRLRSLALAHVSLTAEDLEIVSEDPGAANLESLDLSFNNLGERGVRALNRFRHPDLLRFLNLSHTELGDDGAEEIAASGLLEPLAGIDLSMNQISDRGGRALASCGSSVSPESVDLIYNQISAEVEGALRRRFGEEVCLFRR